MLPAGCMRNVASQAPIERLPAPDAVARARARAPMRAAEYVANDPSSQRATALNTKAAELAARHGEGKTVAPTARCRSP